MKVKILIFVEEIMVFLQDNLIIFPMHNSAHMVPLPEKAEMYLLKMRILTMGKNDLEMTNRMLYYVRLLLYFSEKVRNFFFNFCWSRSSFQIFWINICDKAYDIFKLFNLLFWTQKCLILVDYISININLYNS